MFPINVTTGCRYGGSCLMVTMMSGSAAGSPSESDYSEVTTVSLHLCWLSSSALTAAREAAIKPVALAMR